MSTDTIGLLIVFGISLGGLGIAAYLGYRYRGLSDESSRLQANEKARKESDENLEILKNLTDPDLDKRGSKWVRD